MTIDRANGQVLIGDDLDVADRVAGVAVRVRFASNFDGVQGLVNGALTQSVNVHVNVLRGGTHHHSRHLFFREHGLPAVAGLALVVLEHGGGPALDRCRPA